MLRTIVREHIPKRHLDFENPIKTDKVFDNTVDRIYGLTEQQIMRPTCLDYGTGYNPADDLPKVGRKTQNFEREIALQVAQEMKEKQEREDAVRQQRCFDTTSRTYHDQKSLVENQIGRKVMYTQDGVSVGMAERDQQLIVETGMFRRTAKCSDEELKERIPEGSYLKQRPVTIYTEALERKNTYMSAATGMNPFAITRGMTQPVQKTKAV